MRECSFFLSVVQSGIVHFLLFMCVWTGDARLQVSEPLNLAILRVCAFFVCVCVLANISATDGVVSWAARCHFGCLVTVVQSHWNVFIL